MRLLFLLCITILMFVTSLMTEEDIIIPIWAEGNKKEYAKVLNLSFLFFEAMRSGGRPEFHRIQWRGHSILNDDFNGENLTGGYYNNGNSFVKYAFPTAFATTMLAWSVILWPEAYKNSGNLNAAYSAIKWATEYFMRCHTTKDTLYIQLGAEMVDSKFSGRWEDFSHSRQIYVADFRQPATDIASEIVAAFAAASIVFKDIFHDDPYSKKCFKHAQKLYRFAVRYPGSHYSWMPHDQYETYEENPLGYLDDLTWAALWLFKASKNDKYFRHAETFYWSLISRDDIQNHRTIFDYYSKLPGIAMMLANFLIDDEYESSVDEYIQELLHQHYRTKKGLIFLHEDPLPLAANAAFLCLVAASSGKDKTRQCYNIARHQIDFMLGLLKESDRSYVVGYGRNPPTHIRHKAAACPSKPAPCGWKEQEADVPNPQVLYGALVSGPDANYHFNDTRRSNDSSKYTKVRIEYNAGFTGALAGLLQLHNTDYHR